MAKKRNILVIIPARGGSKGIARKNLRALNNKPLLYYSINIAKKSSFHPDVYISSEDEEILSMAKKLGANIYKRPDELSRDDITLDPVIKNAYENISKKSKKEYDVVVTLQPTSPLLKTSSLDSAIEKILVSEEIDTIISAKKEAHLSWRLDNGKYVPNYKERLNRQYLQPYFIETGAFLICKSSNLRKYNQRIGVNIDLFILQDEETIDIDTYVDWNICEYYLKRKNILFVVAGNRDVGLGHVYRALTLANSITNHNISFLVTKDSDLAYQMIKERNFKVYLQNGDIIEEIDKLHPDIVINDILNTTKKYMKALKKLPVRIINFEDLGEGAELADAVFNALYPEKVIKPNHYFGHDYFCVRDEFYYSPSKKVEAKVNTVLITFGGVDENNLTLKVIESIYTFCLKKNIKINVVTGLGYSKSDTLTKFNGINILEDVRNISEFMLEADIIFSSAGRTVYEIATIGTPAVILAQNTREMTHFFASSENGFINLGLGNKVSKKSIYSVFRRLVNDFTERQTMSKLMLRKNLRHGKNKVLSIINQIIEEMR